MTRNIMLDLETLGVTPNCVVVSIGAAEFDENAIGRKFYSVINIQSSMDAGLETDTKTLAWWLEQSDEARMVLTEASERGHTLGYALSDFMDWMGDKDALVWGNGAGFDPPILAHAYKVCGFGTPPWHHFNVRCYRTLKSLRPDIKPLRFGSLHNALNDAESQAHHAIELLKSFPS